jgi:hypothetical protein
MSDHRETPTATGCGLILYIKKGRVLLKRAGIVVAHAMLRIAYYLLTRKEMYVDLGEDFLINKNKHLWCEIQFED